MSEVLSKQSIVEWLRPFGVQDFHGACTLTYRNTIDLNLELTDDETEFVLSAVIGQVDPSDSEQLVRLLRMNNLGKQTRGATISLEENGEDILLWIATPLSGMDLARFEQVVYAFVDLVEELPLALAP